MARRHVPYRGSTMVGPSSSRNPDATTPTKWLIRPSMALACRSRRRDTDAHPAVGGARRNLPGGDRGQSAVPSWQSGWLRRSICLQIVYTTPMASEETTTVRIRRPDSERLQVLAQRRHTSVIEVVHNAIDALERQDFVRGLASDYERLRSDPERWEQYVHEREEWDGFA